jgi:hypothetical protein
MCIQERRLLTAIIYGISLYNQRFLFLLGGLSMTGYPQSLIFLLAVTYVMIPYYVMLDVMLTRISIICFCTVPSLERFGVVLFPSWGSRRFLLMIQFWWHLNFVGLMAFAKILGPVYKQFGSPRSGLF